MKKTIPYGVANYEELVADNSYFVDKTQYIAQLEAVKNPVFLRPRRFGKSLLCRMLECYYNIRQRDDFDRLFGHTYIGQHPTPRRNSCFVLHFDFSAVEPTGSLPEIARNFNHHCNLKLAALVAVARAHLPPALTIDAALPAAVNLDTLCTWLAAQQLPPLYVIIDEYDNFANQLIVKHQDHVYYDLIRDDGFLKTFFKVLKEGRKTGAIANVFITGVLPILIDDLASGFNIATILTLDPNFEQMLGFTQAEADVLLDEIDRDYGFAPATRRAVAEIIKNHYNGYHFIRPDGESLYNSTILMYFLDYLCTHNGEIPEYLTDMNLKTDLSWVRRITGSMQGNTEEFVGQLVTHNTIAYNRILLVSKFNMATFFQKDFYPISFFYLGMLTKYDDFTMALPNLNMREIFVSYFNELHQIDVSTKYADMMRSFVNQPDLPKLFADYWHLYLGQLPEAIFQQVNENFYRTTFFQLCSMYLSKWFTWNVERSYPQGRSDLEFVGTFHEKFAGLRYVIEFKYYSNAEFNRLKTSIADFQVQPEDTRQLAGYVEGVRQEYPQAQIAQFVIYCFGNQGFRVFAVGKNE